MSGQSARPLRPFPMQDGPPIPWCVAEAIWTHIYRSGQPLETVARRGGFGWDEVSFMWSNPRHKTTREQRLACREAVRNALEAAEGDIIEAFGASGHA